MNRKRLDFASLVVSGGLALVWVGGCQKSTQPTPTGQGVSVKSHGVVDDTSATTSPNFGEPADQRQAAAPPVQPAAGEPGSTTAAQEKTARQAPSKPASDPDVNTAAAVHRVGDWPLWGGDSSRNMVNASTGLQLQLGSDPKTPVVVEEVAPLLWVAQLGSQTYGNPVVANGKVLVGTNNGAEYRPKHKGDRGVVLCFNAEDGELLWQLTREKLPQGQVNDWPEQGICSSPCVVDNRVYVVTNRCEIMCLDLDGFHDGENDGPYTDEVDSEELDADIIWVLDLIEEFGVFPHNLATASPFVYDGMVYLISGNGVDEAHLEIPSPRAPSFLAVNVETGEVAWDDNSPFDKILHGQWSSPSMGIVDGRAQVYMPGGNGWLYAFDAKTGENIWKFDANPKDSKWELGGSGTRNNLIGTPVFLENSVIIGVGQDPEHGEGVGHLYRIDATKSGDVSPVTEDNQPNPNSAQIWQYGGEDPDGSVTGRAGADIFRRTISTVSVKDGLVYAADLGGRLHCVDFATGQRQWEADLFAPIWGSPLAVDGKVLIGDEDGYVVVLQQGRERKILGRIECRSAIYSTPTIAHGVMYISDRSRLYALKVQP